MGSESRYYILNELRVPVPVESEKEWTSWMEKKGNPVVAENRVGKVRVLTRFLGKRDGGNPFFFETRTHGGKFDGVSAQYETWDEAMAGHKEALRRVPL